MVLGVLIGPGAYHSSYSPLYFTPTLSDYFKKDVSSGLSRKENLRSLSSNPVYIIGATALSVIVLHGIEAFCWAVFYLLLGATPNYRSSILYSTNAMTSYGHENLQLAPRWHLMGSLEALSGWILFGLTKPFSSVSFRRLGRILKRNWTEQNLRILSPKLPKVAVSRNQ